MRLRTKYLLFVCTLHLITLGLSYFIFSDNKILFIASETLILVSAVLSWQLYIQLLHPLQTLMRGVDAIKDRDFNVKFIKTGKYEMDQLINVYNDMIDQLRQEKTKQEEQHLFLSKLIYTSPTAIIILDHDKKVQQLNPKATELTGINPKDIIGKKPQGINLPLMHEISRLNSGESSIYTLNGITTYKLKKSHFFDRGFARDFVMIEELTAELLAAEKKAYGKVIRMMAHEVNNTIGPVNSILQSVLKAGILERGEDNSYTNALEVAINRNYNLNHFMRNFADVVRLPTPVKTKMDLHHSIRSVSHLFKLHLQEKQINFRYDIADEPFYIYADGQQMEQALINIVKNAVEAIIESGTITFLTERNPFQLLITDTGAGISPDISGQLFSPFFSSKKDGQGIGLTLVKEILVNHGFDVSLQTISPGQTRFTIRFN